MLSKSLRRFRLGAVVFAGLALGAFPLAAQQGGANPTGAAAAGAASRADAVARIQQMIASSGLTPDQIRAQLRAQGYPDQLLDQYLPGSTSTDTTAVPSDTVFAALRAIGIGDTLSTDSLRTTARRQTRARSRADSAFLDSIALAATDDSTRDAIRRILRSSTAVRAQADSGFTIFGLDLFPTTKTTQFDPDIAGGVDPNYRLGPGDQLTLFLTGQVEKSYPQITVTPDGLIVLPDVGQIPVANLTLGQLEDVLYTRLGRVYSGVRRGPDATTRFAVSVSKLGVNQVVISGDVKQPGAYRVSRAATVMNALYQAGGPTERGSMRDIQVKRGGKTVATVDVYDYATSGDASHDIRLENGDIVFVPARGQQVRIAGAVIRPATYELRGNETLADLIRMAGGFTASADRRRVQIERIVPPAERTTAGSDRKLIDVTSDLFTTALGPAAPVRAGDIVRVFEIPKRVTNGIAIKGNVWTPGPLALEPQMKLSTALARAGGLKPDTYLGEVQISRLLPDSTRMMLRTALQDTSGHAERDFPLADGDEITVFSVTDFRPQRYVTITGAVRRPGRVPYRDGMTLRDLVLLAGGVQEGAYLKEAELARLPENRAGGVTATTQRVPLDSSYLFDAKGVTIASSDGVAQAGTERDVVLQPYDAVAILRQPDFEMQRFVTVQGEVRYPGSYALRTKNEKLASVIARAGGLTNSAYADGIGFYRKQNKIGRVGVDLPGVLKDTNFVDNLRLVDGDSIYIPTYAPVVSVKGAVNSPVAVAYVDGANIDYYIRAAGGGNPSADLGRAYVTQSNGKVESRGKFFKVFNSTPHPQPGSTVSVPVRDPNDRGIDWLTIATTATTTLTSVVTLYALLKSTGVIK